MEQLLKTYNQVFDVNGNVVACGREKCKELIKLCNENEEHTDFGDINTGFMNVENIKTLYEKVVMQ